MAAKDNIRKLQAQLLSELEEERKFIEKSLGLLEKASKRTRPKSTRRSSKKNVNNKHEGRSKG